MSNAQGQEPYATADSHLARAVLVKCPRCGVDGPTALLGAHERFDHAGEPPLPEQFVVAIPPRFRPVLERLQAKSGRSFSAMIEAALDEWLRGRQKKNFEDGWWVDKQRYGRKKEDE